MTRARRRMAHRTRLNALSPHQRWVIQQGNRESRWAFPTEADWDETFDAVKDALLEEIDDPASMFRGFWLYDESVPTELRRDLHQYGHIRLDGPTDEAYRAAYAQLIAARRAWLAERGLG